MFLVIRLSLLGFKFLKLCSLSCNCNLIKKKSSLSRKNMKDIHQSVAVVNHYLVIREGLFCLGTKYHSHTFVKIKFILS